MEGQDFTIDGIPSTLEGAVDLWAKDKYHFQQWAVEQADGFVTTKRTADGGIDGRIYFAVPDSKELQGMMVEVKGGANVTIESLRALKGVLDYENALMAGPDYPRTPWRCESTQLQSVHSRCWYY